MFDRERWELVFALVVFKIIHFRQQIVFNNKE